MVALILIWARASSAEDLPEMRPALMGSGSKALVNLIDTQHLIQRGQGHSACDFYCLVAQNGHVASSRVYGSLPNSQKLKEEVRRRIGDARFIPAVYNHRHILAWFSGTILFDVVDGKPHLRIFANQELSELLKRSDFIAPQQIYIPNQHYDYVPYPGRSQWSDDPPALVEVSITVDAAGNLTDCHVKKQTPAGDRFGENALKIVRQRKYLPAFRNGKPVESTTVEPLYYVGDRFELR